MTTLVRLLLLIFLIPKLLYVSSITESPHDASRRMEQRIYKFLWKCPAKVISNSVINTLEYGGSNLTELQMQIKALRLSWTARILDERKGTLKSCFNFLLRNSCEAFFKL